MSVSKTLRFEVFKRDGFRCAYCGKGPPQVVLELDHIEPVSLGGSDDVNNLITSCFECNRGKRNIPLNLVPAQLAENLEVLKEKEAQIREYRRFLKAIERREDQDIEKITAIYRTQYQGWTLSEEFKGRSLRHFVRSLPIDEVEDAMHIAIRKVPDDKDGVIQYFCGVCWRKIRRAKEDAED